MPPETSSDAKVVAQIVNADRKANHLAKGFADTVWPHRCRYNTTA